MKVYDVFIEGAKEGFDVAIRIIPFLVGILVAIGMFRGSGAMDLLTRWRCARWSRRPVSRRSSCRWRSCDR